MNGVIENLTGDLLRWGFVDFENDGSFNSASETIRTDVPFPGKSRGDEDLINMHRYTGGFWVEVPQS